MPVSAPTLWTPPAHLPMRVALLLAVFWTPACAQPPDEAARPAPYPCEGCEVVRRPSPDTLGWRLAMASDDEPGARLVLDGRVLQADGRTPAPGVVLYLHQTDATGVYRRDDGGALALQGWLKTDADGRYRIETVRPGPYPSGTMPAHVHVYVGEPGRAPYYLNDVVFADDPLVTEAYRATLLDGPDPGVVSLTRTASGWRGERDFVLAP